MKRFRIAIILVLTATIIFLCCGCSKLMESVENDEVREYTNQMIDSIIAKDFDTSYSLVENAYTKDEFAREYNSMEALLYDVKSYELKLIGFKSNVNIKDGKKLSTTNSTYEMTENDDKYIVYVATNSDCEKLSYFNVKAYESTNLYYTGTIDKMGNASAFQWIMIVTNLFAIALTIIAVIDCSKQKIKKKALWIIIIIFALISGSLSIAQGTLNLNLSLGLFMNYSAFIKYGDGSMVLRLMLPVGAIIYFIVKKHLINKANTPPEYAQHPQPQMYPQPSQPQQYENPYTPPTNDNLE